MQKRLIALIFIFSFLITPVFADKQDPMLEISKGTIDGHSRIHKFGHNEDVGNTLEVIWSLGDGYNFTDVAEIMNVSSTDVDDTVLGTGAWNISLFGLDANYVPQSETIQLNGQTPVQTLNAYLRVNRAYVHESGTSPANEGGIYIGHGDVVAGVNANPLAYIDILYGQTTMAVYTIPENCTGYMETFTVSTFGSVKEFEVYLFLEEFNESVRRIEEFHLGEDTFQNLYIPPRPIQERTDIYAVCQVGVGGGIVSAAFDIILVADDAVNIEETFNVNIVESIDLMSTEFFVFIIAALATMYLAWGTNNNRKSGLGFAFSALFWIATMYVWAIDQVGTQLFNLMWLFLAPFSFCVVMFLERSWGQMDDATKSIADGRGGL